MVSRVALALKPAGRDGCFGVGCEIGTNIDPIGMGDGMVAEHQAKSRGAEYRIDDWWRGANVLANGMRKPAQTPNGADVGVDDVTGAPNGTTGRHDFHPCRTPRSQSRDECLW